MKLLLLNANTTAAMTAKMAAAAQKLAPVGTEIVAATGRFGAAYISTRSAAAIAGHAALDLLAEHVGPGNPAGFDAVALACFGDPGLLALKELSPIPVFGMAEASLTAASQLGMRIGIITGGLRWIAMLNELAALLGFTSRLAGIRASSLTGAEIAADPDGAAGQLATLAQDLVTQDGADILIFGGAGLVGFAPRLQPQIDVPLLDSLSCLITQSLAAARLATIKPVHGSLAVPPPVAVTGLSQPLARWLGAPSLSA